MNMCVVNVTFLTSTTCRSCSQQLCVLDLYIIDVIEKQGCVCVCVCMCVCVLGGGGGGLTV